MLRLAVDGERDSRTFGEIADEGNRSVELTLQVHIFATQHNYAAPQQNQHIAGLGLSQLPRRLRLVPLIYVPSASAANDE